MKLAAKRANNRNEALLEAAAELFATKGFRETTMRDIAAAAGMLPGSIYYHYGSKDELLLGIYETGVESFTRGFAEALGSESDPWARLRRGMAFHIAAITRDDAYTRVVNRVAPSQVPKHREALVALRDRYERCFAALIERLAAGALGRPAALAADDSRRRESGAVLVRRRRPTHRRRDRPALRAPPDPARCRGAGI